MKNARWLSICVMLLAPFRVFTASISRGIASKRSSYVAQIIVP